MTTGFALAAQKIDERFYDGDVKDTFNSRVLGSAICALGNIGCRLTQEQVAEKIGIAKTDLEPSIRAS